LTVTPVTGAIPPMRFFLGTHETSWLKRTDVDLFISRRRLARHKKLPRAVGRWALDSGGFSELAMFGAWQTPADQYADEAQRWRDAIGGLDWAAIQDWMCEPFMLAKTGRTIQEHQEATVQSYLDLKTLAPTMPWAPVLQGWTVEDYHRHVGMYAAAGVKLSEAPIVGVGSVCRRQATKFATELFWSLSKLNLPLHAFGVKTTGLRRFGATLASSDSLAWSKGARGKPVLKGCDHASCANCMRYALKWRAAVIRQWRKPQQPTFW
jgi:hypothetical protein